MRGQERCRYDEFLPALASETRQAILELLVSREMTVIGLTEEMGLSQPTVSHHLAILRRAGLVKVRREGQWTFYTVNGDCLATCFRQLLDQLGLTKIERRGK